MKNIPQIFLSTLAAFVVACGGGPSGPGSGNTSTGGKQFTHQELAAEFIRRFNVEIDNYEIEAVKVDTQSYNYIVVWDSINKQYDAYFIGDYNPGENLVNYLNANRYRFFYNLYKNGNTYSKTTYDYKYVTDPFTGKSEWEWVETRYVFEKLDQSMNLDQIAAFQEMVVIDKTAGQLREKYGMSEEAALETARFSHYVAQSPAGVVDERMMDRFSQKLTGSSITQFNADLDSGNTEGLQKRIEIAKEKTGLSDQGIQDLFFGK